MATFTVRIYLTPKAPGQFRLGDRVPGRNLYVNLPGWVFSGLRDGSYSEEDVSVSIGTVVELPVTGKAVVEARVRIRGVTAEHLRLIRATA